MRLEGKAYLLFQFGNMYLGLSEVVCLGTLKILLQWTWVTEKNTFLHCIGLILPQLTSLLRSTQLLGSAFNACKEKLGSHATTILPDSRQTEQFPAAQGGTRTVKLSG